MWLDALKHAAKLRVASGIANGEDDEDDGEGAFTEDERASLKEGADLGPLSNLGFGHLKLPATNPRLADIGKHAKDFGGARELFKLGSARAARAKSTFVLDGFVTTHFEVLECEASLYLQLAMWETDPGRKFAMHKRRYDLLRPPLDELSEKAYTQLVRQGLFDCSTIACEMLEVKAAQFADEPPPRRAKRLEASRTLAVTACTDFLSRFDTDDGKPATKVEAEQERAYLTCRFHLARAHGKVDTSEALGASLKEYELLNEYVARNKPEGFEHEAAMCKEMAELLPHKMKHALKMGL